MNDPRLAALEDWNACLEQLVSSLAAAEDSDDGMSRPAWSRCAVAFERFRELDESTQGPYSDEVRAQMQHAQRLQAVAAGLASRAKEGLSAELQTLGDTRQRLRQAHEHVRRSEPGVSCDISG